ncbi:MAG: hypothetical protein H0V89_11305, partial [Deltaproteobacteria bacterium]|nr:hypothetical protein [Deltaproteobacteria bacterium]
NLASSLAGSVAAVLPVWSLVAETVACGRLREADAATVTTIAELSDEERAMLFMSVDDFSTRPEGPAPLARRRLQDLLAHAGARRAVDVARSGARGAARLTAALDDISGRRALEEAIDRLAERADVLRASRMLADAWNAAHDDYAVGEPLRDAVASLRHRPEVHRLEEARALDALDAGSVALADGDERLARAVLTREVPTDLDLDAAIDRWREIENLTGDLHAKHVAQVVTRSLTLQRGRP